MILKRRVPYWRKKSILIQSCSISLYLFFHYLFFFEPPLYFYRLHKMHTIWYCIFIFHFHVVCLWALYIHINTFWQLLSESLSGTGSFTFCYIAFFPSWLVAMMRTWHKRERCETAFIREFSFSRWIGFLCIHTHALLIRHMLLVSKNYFPM